jgi:hypothetical protein
MPLRNEGPLQRRHSAGPLRNEDLSISNNEMYLICLFPCVCPLWMGVFVSSFDWLCVCGWGARVQIGGGGSVITMNVGVSEENYK